jgi:hypothetical protein
MSQTPVLSGSADALGLGSVDLSPLDATTTQQLGERFSAAQALAAPTMFAGGFGLFRVGEIKKRVLGNCTKYFYNCMSTADPSRSVSSPVRPGL